MNQHDFYSWHRLQALIYREALLNRRRWLLEFAALAALLLVIGGIQVIGSQTYAFGAFQRIAELFFVIGGAVIASQAFEELRKPGREQMYMNLPASVFEKLASAWLVRSLGFTICAFLVFVVMSLICGSLSQLVIGAGWQVYNPFRPEHLKMTGELWVFQTIFLLGAAYFKRYPFVKTLLSCIGVVVVFTAWWLLLFGLGIQLMPNIPEPFQSDFTLGFELGMGMIADLPVFYPALEPVMETLSRVLYIAIAPFCLVVTYCHLKARTF